MLIGSGFAACPACNKVYLTRGTSAVYLPFCSRRCFKGKPKRIRRKNSIRYLEKDFSPEQKDAARAIRKQARQAAAASRKENAFKRIPGKDFYVSPEWRDLRFKVLRKYGSVCMLCFRPAKSGFPMHVDHIKPRSKYPELELEFDNLQVLCEDCNLGKSNHTEDDFRPKE